MAGELVEDAGEGMGVPLARGEEDEVRAGAVAESMPDDAIVRGVDFEAGELVGHGGGGGEIDEMEQALVLLDACVYSKAMNAT